MVKGALGCLFTVVVFIIIIFILTHLSEIWELFEGILDGLG